MAGALSMSEDGWWCWWFFVKTSRLFLPLKLMLLRYLSLPFYFFSFLFLREQREQDSKQLFSVLLNQLF